MPTAGSVSKYQTAHGARWQIVIELGRDAEGRRRQKRKRGYRTKTAATAALNAELADRNDGSYIEPSRQPLAAYLAEWLSATGPSRAPTSNYTYQSEIAYAIAPRIGHIALADLTPQTLQRWLNELSKTHAPATVRHARHLLAAALNQAVAWRLLPRSPLVGTKLPAGRAEPKPVWSATDARRFLAVADADPEAALWRLLLDGGLRIGEALALRWADVDFAAGVVLVRRTLTRDRAGRLAFGADAKTSAGRRAVALSAAAMAVLRAQRTAQTTRRLAAPHWAALDLVCDGGMGQMRHPDLVRRRLPALCAAAGVPRLSPHGLRHTSITLLMLAGVPLKVIAARSGHRSIATTADIYAHVSAEADRSAADTLGAVLEDARGA